MERFPEIDRMPDFPALPVPDYAALNRGFRAALMNPDNRVLRHSENGHPIFGAYVDSLSNEMVTWGILAVGEWLLNRDTAWIAPTYEDFFSKEHGIFLNSPGHTTCEHWYLFYVNTLAGAVLRTLFDEDEAARERMGQSADTMLRMARKLTYDFNQQGYRFHLDAPFTNKDIYRQPDSIAGFGYNMLFAALQCGRPEYLQEAVDAMRRYQAFAENPWYEIPNGSAGLMAGAWLNAHGHPMDVHRMAAWVFDHEKGPMQVGKWGREEIDGLMMGWRGDTRQMAIDATYSMETLMPLQFLLPAVRYAPGLADAIGKYARCVLSNFQLFYAMGQEKLYETRPDLDANIPYEKLDRERDGHTPAACGDFAGHRSVYGAGYLYWLEALARPTNNADIFALDLSLTDWLAARACPVYLLRNPHDHDVDVTFSPAPVWQRRCTALFQEGTLHAHAWNLESVADLGAQTGEIRTSVPAHGTALIALLPEGASIAHENGFLRCNGAELLAR